MPGRVIDYIWYTVVIAAAAWSSMKVIEMTAPQLAMNDVSTALFDGLITLIRVAVLIVLASVMSRK
jgi:NitT/TauT family transport system permease protein